MTNYDATVLAVLKALAIGPKTVDDLARNLGGRLPELALSNYRSLRGFVGELSALELIRSTAGSSYVVTAAGQTRLDAILPTRASCLQPTVTRLRAQRNARTARGRRG